MIHEIKIQGKLLDFTLVENQLYCRKRLIVTLLIHPEEYIYHNLVISWRDLLSSTDISRLPFE